MVPRNLNNTGSNNTNVANSSLGRIPGTRNGPNRINAIPNKMNTLQNDINFNRSFANTQMRMYNNDNSSLETLDAAK